MIDEPIMPERRRSVRFRAAKPATILAGTKTIRCFLRDLSQGGARVKLEAGVEVPDAFLLQIGHARPRPAHIVWRGDRQLGIAFGGDQPVGPGLH